MANPSTWTHTIAWQLEVNPAGKILIPGSEPASDLSSRVLGAYLAKQGPINALVDVKVALAAIPGSYLKYGSNYNRGNMRQTWFVLPPLKPDCPCDS